jgi:NAD(P)-dependent dehydrogenase (short-subunit alcohol dehydrogenase family)
MTARKHAVHGKVALITGASSGIGKAAAQLFAAHGAKVVITARRATEIEAVADEIRRAGGDAVALAGDARDEAHQRAAVELAVARYDGLDMAFNNVGSLGEMAPAHTVSADGWRETLESNLTSAFLGIKAQVPAMLARGGGSLVFTSTFVGHTVGFPNMAAYAASKAGLVGLVQVLAAELGPSNIRANVILSGGVDTPMGRIVANTPEALAFVQSLHALKRVASPTEIAHAALFLCSSDASFITGAAIPVDGGVSITRT